MGFPRFWNGSKNDIIYYVMPRPFVMQMLFERFLFVKGKNIFYNILLECFNRSSGFDEKQAQSMFDNFNSAYSQGTCGVLTLLSEAMIRRTTVYLHYDEVTGVARRATGEEQARILADYQRQARSDEGVLCNFNRFDKADLVKMYLGLLYGALEAMNTQTGLARALKFKAKDLRVTQSNISNEKFVNQAKAIVEGLKEGKSILIDKEDEVDLTKIDSAPIKEAVSFYSQLMAGELGVSSSFITGVVASGMNSTGEAEIEKNEAGIKLFFNSIFKPACDALFDIDLKFKTDNYRRVAELSKSLPYMESSEAVTPEDLADYVNYMFGRSE